MSRYSVVDVRRAFEAHVHALDVCHIPYDGRLVLEEGSSSNGIAYRLVRVDGGAGQHRPPIGDDFLGRTATEAFENLCDRTGHIYDFRRACPEVAA